MAKTSAGSCDCTCTGAIREFTCAVDERIGDHHQVDVGVCGDAAGVDLTDSAGAEQGQSQAFVVGT